MQRVILSLLLLAFSTFTSQAQDFKEELKNEVCACFSSVNGFNAETFRSCFMDRIDKFKGEVEKLIDSTSEVSEYEQGRALGRQLFLEIQTGLIHDCDPYYHFMDSLRNHSLVVMKAKYSPETIDSLSKQIASDKSIDLLWERANLYFANDELKKAEQDYRACLDLNPQHAPSLYFLGWLYERKGDYTKALEYYESVLEQGGKQEMMLFVEMAKRKSRS